MSDKRSHIENFSEGPIKYRQTDITCFFGNSKMKRYDKGRKLKSTSITTVIINDSDSDFETHENNPPKNQKKVPRLPFPMSDDEDELDASTKEIFLGATPTKIDTKKKNHQTFSNASNNYGTSDATIIVNKSASNDMSHPKILQNLIISPGKNENKRSLNNNVKSMMQLNRPKKSCKNEEIFQAATSTPIKNNIQRENNQTLPNASNNSSTTSNDTIILNKSFSSDINDPAILQSPVITPRKESNDNKHGEDELIEEILQSSPKKQKKNDTTCETQHLVVEPNFKNCNLKIEISLSMIHEMDKGNIASAVNVISKMNEAPNFISPSTSGETTFSAGKRLPYKKKASKQLFACSSTNRSDTTYEKNLGFPKDSPTKLVKNENQSTPKKKVTLAGISTLAKKKSTSPKSSVSQIKPEEDDEKLNFKHLDSIKELFKNSLEDCGKRQLLLATDIEIINEFLEMNVHYQYLLMKLFLYLPKWYNITKYCTRIKLDQKLSPKEVTTMYNYLKERKFVDTDLKSLDVDVLLDMLSQPDLKRICTRFKIGKCAKKNEMITILKKNCRTQSTLSSVKSTEDLLKDAAVQCLGFCVKLREDIKNSFYKTYLLQTFINSSYLDPQIYLRDMNYSNIIYPYYTIEGYFPFSNREQFTSFYEAVLLKNEYTDASDKKNNVSMKNICDNVFKRLQNITSEGKISEQLSDYLQGFSAEYQYISILKTASKKLIKYHESVKIWLQFLVENYTSHYALGFWYKQLAHVLVNYDKDYESAAKIVIHAFELNKEKDIFNLVELYDLNVLAAKIRTTKSYKVCALFCDKLSELAELSIKYDHFPKKNIAGHTDRSGTTGRRTYSYFDENGEENFGNVETIVLNDYKKEENYEGIHCEGRLLASLFALFFWDIIYCYVPNTFIYKFQRAPLDMYTGFFYKNRKSDIDQRLEDIAQKWSSERMKNILKENWDKHSHEATITDFSLFTNFQELLRMFECINREVLSKMFRRLVTNFKTFRSGLPDLFLWDSNLSKCKFVEVKGEGDKLSHKQILWIQYLIDIGADVEVCHVSGVGSRKMKLAKVNDSSNNLKS